MEMAELKPQVAIPFFSSDLINAQPAIERQRIYLLPGQLQVAAEPCHITTILGSCVAICLFDRYRLAGGMNHFLLPTSRMGEECSLRFADTATVTLLEKLLALGCKLESLTAKIFGGAALFRGQEEYAETLGAKNVQAAVLMLERAGIPIVAQETGGNCGRKIVFDTEDGTVWSKRV